jgi:DNA-binding GntR family transcriptional regulator
MKNFIKHKSLVEHIAQALEQQILGGALKPGQRIIEGTLCEALGVSRSPVREAFRILEGEGFLTAEPRKGISVARITPEELQDIYLIRANLESLAVYLAVKKQNPDVLEKLKKLHDQMIQVAAKKNIKTYFQLNLKFHEVMTHACENKRLIQLINTFFKQTMRYRLEVLSIPGWMNSSLKDHTAIIQSFEAGDAEKAESLRKNMILNHVKRFSKIFNGRKEDED